MAEPGKSDLTIAQSHIKGAYLEDLRYHAQQAAEKSVQSSLAPAGW